MFSFSGLKTAVKRIVADIESNSKTNICVFDAIVFLAVVRRC